VASWALFGMGRLSRQLADLTADPQRQAVVGK